MSCEISILNAQAGVNSELKKIPVYVWNNKNNTRIQNKERYSYIIKNFRKSWHCHA
jgi:hypothetical protein